MSRIDVNEYGTFYYNDKNELHREDGPAAIRIDGRKKWWLKDKERLPCISCKNNPSKKTTSLFTDSEDEEDKNYCDNCKEPVKSAEKLC